MDYFKNIIGYDDVKRELNIALDMILNYKKYDNLGANPIRGILLHGDPGTGKTTLAKDFIDASGLGSFVVRKNKSDGEFLDLITDTFKKACKHANTNNTISIVFLDDMDKFANGDNRRRNCEEYVTIQSCIDEYESHPIIVIATANDIDNLPDSLLRSGRFDKVIKIKNPSGEDAIKIIKHYLDKKKHIGNVNYEEIAQIMSGASCATLEAIINEAAISVAYNNKKKIENKELIKAAMHVIYDAPENLNNKEDKYLINIAYHEAGHAVIGELLEPGSINLISVAKYNGQTSGITSYNQDEDYFKDIEFMENRVMSLLGGKAANEIAFGVYDVGCNDDLHRAYNVVSRFIDDYCILGFNNWEGITIDGSDSLRNRKETLVSYQMQQYYNKVKKLLINNKSFLDELANELVVKKTITKNDIKSIKSHYFA